MFEQAFNQLLNNIHNNQLQQLNLITTASQRETINVTPLQSWEGHTSPVYALAVLHDGSVVSGSYDMTLRHWDPQSGQCLSTWKGHTSWVKALAVLHDGSVVSASKDKTLRRWDSRSEQCLSSWTGHTSHVTALAVLPDGSVVSASHDNTLRHWGPQSGQCFSTWYGHTHYVNALAVLHDGSVVSASLDNTLRRWDPQTGQCLSTWKGHTRSVTALAVLPDGSAVSGSHDNTLRHWDPQSGQCLSTWYGHTSAGRALAVLQDGSVVSGSADGTLRHWDPQSGQCLSTWKGHTDTVRALAVLPDGSVVSASHDNTLRHWPVLPAVLTLEQVEEVLEALKHNRSVQSLALSGVTFTPSTTQALAQVIVIHPQLSSIALENGDLTDENIQPLLNALKNPTSRVTQFNVPNNPKLSQNVQNALQMLSRQYPDPQWTETQTKDIKALLNNTLKYLDWSDAPLTQAQVLGLAGALTMNHSLRALFLEDAQVDTLGVQALAQVLKTHPRVQKLMLDKNPLGEQGVQAVLDVFQHHNTPFKVNAALETRASKPQRQQLKAYNKQYTARKEQAAAIPAAADESALPAHFYDRTWEGNQIMAEPAFSCALGKVMEKERLVKLGDQATLQQPIVVLPLVEEHIRETVTETLPHAWHGGTVYLPQHWVLGVLQAIQAGEDNALVAYWERHPGLVTHRYETEAGPLPVYRLLMNARRQGAFAQWLAYYSRYHNDDPTLPAIVTWFTQVKEGHHALHHLIQSIDAKEQEGWFREVRFDLGVTSGVYHGLVHLHSPETLKADSKAIEHLVAQGLLPTEADKEGYTPLMRAVMEEHYALAKLLLPYSETQAVDKEGYTPLMRAVMKERYALAKLLLPYSQIQAVDKAGNTVLHHLAKASPSEAREHCIVKLLSLGVDDSCPNRSGETPRALLGASKEEGGLGQYETLVRAARMDQGRYVARLEKTIASLLEKSEPAPLEKSRAESMLKATLPDEASSAKAYQMTKQCLHQLFFASELALDNSEKAAMPPAPGNP